MAELLTGQALFQGRDCLLRPAHGDASDGSTDVEQINVIMQLIGRPSPEYVASLESEPVRACVDVFVHVAKHA